MFAEYIAAALERAEYEIMEDEEPEPYSEEPGDEREITKGLMKLSEQSLHDFLASEPDIYKDEDLKVRYR